MTQNRDVNKCRRKEKFKMAALIRQANSGYELTNKPKIKTKDVWWKSGRESKQNNDNNNKQTLWKERGGRKCQRATWQRLDTHNPCTRCNPLSSDNNTAGQQTLTRLPPHSYIVNGLYKPRNKRSWKRKKTVKWQDPAQPQTITQGGHEIASLLN